MPLKQRDPKFDEMVEFLPADGSQIRYIDWLQDMRNAGRNDLCKLVHKARRTGAINFEVLDYSNPAESHMVSRVAPAANLTREAVVKANRVNKQGATDAN